MPYKNQLVVWDLPTDGPGDASLKGFWGGFEAVGSESPPKKYGYTWGVSPLLRL